MADAALAVDEARDHKLAELRHIYDQLAEHQRFNQLDFYKPYPKQKEFHDLGGRYRERMLMAANQVGKTLSAGAEVAMHLTGRYPDWWQGYRSEQEVYWWVCGVTGETTRDNVQRILMGRKRDYGTGMIPRDAIIGKPTLARGVPDLLDSVEVRHVSGGTSILWFKSYEKGREKAQGETLDGAWNDEEPPLEFYTEVLTRTNAKRAPILLTFTPLLGMSSVVSRFLSANGRPDDLRGLSAEEKEALKEIQELDANTVAQDEPQKLGGRTYVMMELRDAAHYSDDDIEEIESSYPEHEREARTRGIPMLGSGRVYPIMEPEITFDVTEFSQGFPSYWPAIGAVDFADWDHPVAGVWGRWDRDSDTVYIYDCYRQNRAVASAHAKAFRDRGADIPIAWPHDGHKHDRQSGEPISKLWRKEGVSMLRQHAQFEDGSNSVEAGITKITDMMEAGQFKVAAHLSDWWEEFRLYHRKNGKIHKERDDLMDATRYLVMSLRFARRRSGTRTRLVARTTLDDYSVFDQ